MQTKYFSARNIANGIMVILLLTALLILTSEKAGAKAVEERSAHSLVKVGDCLGNKTPDDIYPGIPDRFCLPESSTLYVEISENEVEQEILDVPPTETRPVITPEVTATAEPTQEPTETPACETKNKNDDKKPGENPCDGDAGGGNG